MLVGDAAQRTKKGSGMKSQTCFRCYSGPNFGGDNAAPCADARFVPLFPCPSPMLTIFRLDTETLPSGPCLGGIRSNILYPT